MFQKNCLVATLVIAGATGLGGCPGRTNNSLVQAPVVSIPQAADASKTDSLATGRSRHSSKPAGDWSSAVYTNSEYGLSFRYPRDYALEDGEVDEHSFFLRRQDELEPDTHLLATILIPDDGYPNTTFEHGSLQVLVHEGLDGESCRNLVDPDNGAVGAGRVRSLNTESGPIWWSEEKSIVDGTQIVEREYAAVIGGRCYEFYAVVAVGESTDAQGAEKPADAVKILRQLEKILLSVRVSGTRVPSEDVSRAGK